MNWMGGNPVKGERAGGGRGARIEPRGQNGMRTRDDRLQSVRRETILGRYQWRKKDVPVGWLVIESMWADNRSEWEGGRGFVVGFPSTSSTTLTSRPVFFKWVSRSAPNVPCPNLRRQVTGGYYEGGTGHRYFEGWGVGMKGDVKLSEGRYDPTLK